MSDEYKTEIERFINRSVEYLERKRKEDMSIIVETTKNRTKQRYKTYIRIEKIEEQSDEEQH